MLKVIYIVFAISLFHNSASAQWVQQTSGVSAGLVEVRFIDHNSGWICGNGGTILRTLNGGVNWMVQNSGTPTKNLGDIFPVDGNIVYCVGWFETILKSTDGGSNWTALRNGPDNTGKNYLAAHFINQNTGWIAGQGFYVLKTTNGGVTFDSSFVPAGIYDVFFKDNLNGLLAGEAGNVFKSTNGGLNWYEINVLGEAAEFFELAFIGDTGWIAGWQNRKVYKTTNFGASWDSLGRVTPGPEIWNATSLFFSSLTTGWICGGAGNIWRTSNGGYNWFKQVTPSNLGYGGIFFVNDSIGWSLGNSGLIVHTVTSGQIVGFSSLQNETQNHFSLSQNFPNPFNPTTDIKYQVSINNVDVKLTIFDVRGREIEVLVNGKHDIGNFEIKLNAENLASGIYFYTLETEDIRITRKMILIK